LELTMSVARLTVPEALHLPALRSLADAVAAALADPAARLVVLAGDGPAFCRGLDLEALDEAADPGPALALFADCLQAISLAGKPTLALVAGPALGGGVGLAAACDVVVADENASFALPELLMGLTPATILPLLLKRMTAQQVRLWALQGKTHDAHAAQRAGLVDEVIRAGEAAAATRRWARALCRARAGALAPFKQLLAEERGGQETAIRRGAALTTAALGDDRVLGPLRAFRQTGTPPWEGEEGA
jgi:enoyl-CoA hydratase/carnithine racemase